MARPPKVNPTSRLNLEMPEETRRKLENLRKETNADSLAEVIRKALAVYDFLWHERAGGSRLMMRSEDGEKELVLL